MVEPGAAGPPSGTVTFLFSDVEGSTSLWEVHPGPMRAALARHDEIVRGVMAAHGGYVFSTAGDAFSVAFGVPAEAVRGALALQEALAGEPWPDPVAIVVRVGLHTGSADERDGDYFGPAVNRAARIMGLARGGDVLASVATVELARDLVREGVSFVDLGAAQLRGIGTEHLFGVTAPGHEHPFALVLGGPAGVVRLPLAANSFIGRELEVVELRAALSSGRLVTLVGPGGVGKTRLAVEGGWAAAHDFPDGVWLAELAPVRERGAVAHTLVAALEVRPIPGRAPTDALVAGLGGQRRLVVIDNCEHVLDEAAVLVRQLVERCPTVTFLVTSRAPLAIAGERVWPVSPLPTAGAATALFIDRAAAAGSTYTTGEAEEAIGSLCARLDGMPLAIELAAARARALTPAELLARLDDRFRLLRSARRDRDERHATLQATVEWSYQLLDETARQVFDHLGVFAGPVDLAAVVAVSSDGELDDLDVLDAVTTLVDHSLVVAEHDAGVTRYRLLDTMRAFARTRRLARDELAATARRHAEWVASRVALLNEQLVGPDEAAALAAVEAMERVWPDLRAAITHAVESTDTDLTARLLGTFSLEALLRERDELSAWADLAFELPGIFEHPLACALLGLAAILDWRAGRFDEMEHRVQHGTLLRSTGAPDPAGQSLQAEVIALVVRGQVEEAYAINALFLEQLGGRQPPSFHESFFAVQIALCECYLGLPQRASATIQALPQFTNPILRCFTGWVHSTALLEIDPVAAIAPGRDTVALARAIKATWMVDTVSNYLTAALSRAGDTTEALETMRSVLAHTSAGGGVQSLANTVRNGVVLFTRLGQPHAAAMLLGWVSSQTITIPGTASMRAHAAQAAEQLAADLGADTFATAQTRGAAMPAGDIVQLLLSELDRATTTPASP